MTHLLKDVCVYDDSMFDSMFVQHGNLGLQSEEATQLYKRGSAIGCKSHFKQDFLSLSLSFLIWKMGA